MKPTDYIKIADCKKGYLYKIECRNLSFGVYDGNEGFIGIRTKFSDRYLFTEYHYDQGAPFGTVFPEKELEQIPEGIEIRESLTEPGKKGLLMNWPLFNYLESKLKEKQNENQNNN